MYSIMMYILIGICRCFVNKSFDVRGLPILFKFPFYVNQSILETIFSLISTRDDESSLFSSSISCLLPKLTNKLGKK